MLPAPLATYVSDPKMTGVAQNVADPNFNPNPISPIPTLTLTLNLTLALTLTPTNPYQVAGTYDYDYPISCAATLYGSKYGVDYQASPSCEGSCPAGKYCGTS